MADKNPERLFPERELLREKGLVPSPSTAWRWRLRGVGPTKVRLPSVRVGGRFFLTEEGLANFISALNPTPAAPPVAPPSAEKIAARHRKALADLDRG